jgi:hypothetical protein
VRDAIEINVPITPIIIILLKNLLLFIFLIILVIANKLAPSIQNPNMYSKIVKYRYTCIILFITIFLYRIF